uniref:Uncharacterized protein n=1 Tax=Chenopodium quinoa TaxID=63459 RepID=A0A803N340_CHEQI
MGYNGAFFLIDDEEDALSLLSIAEKNVGAHLNTPINFQCPIYLDELSDDEDLRVAHLTRAGRHYKPSYLEDVNPVEALRRKEKDKELTDENKEEDDAIKRMKECSILYEEEGNRLDRFTIHNIGFDSIVSWKEEEETEEDPEEDLEEDEETDEDPEEETEEDPEEELQENDNDSEVNPQKARSGTNWSNEDEAEEEPKTPKDNDPCFRGESWTSNSFRQGHDEGSRKRSRVEDFDLDFDILCYRRLVYLEEGEIAQAFSDWAFEFRQTDTEKLKLVNMKQSDRESFSHLFSRCSYIRAQLRFPITDRDFMLILLRKLNDFYYRHMVSVKYVALSHMERHGYKIDAYRLQERRPKVHPQGERANRRIFTRIDEPLSVVYDHLSKKGILRAKSYDLIDHRIITPAHSKSNTPETNPTQPQASQADLFLQLLEQGRIKPLPRRAGADPVGKNLNKYCHYHQLHGHDTNECHALRWCIKRTTGISCPNKKVSLNALSILTREDDPTLLIARHYSEKISQKDYEEGCSRIVENLEA